MWKKKGASFYKCWKHICFIRSFSFIYTIYIVRFSREVHKILSIFVLPSFYCWRNSNFLWCSYFFYFHFFRLFQNLKLVFFSISLLKFIKFYLSSYCQFSISNITINVSIYILWALLLMFLWVFFFTEILYLLLNLLQKLMFWCIIPLIWISWNLLFFSSLSCLYFLCY